MLGMPELTPRLKPSERLCDVCALPLGRVWNGGQRRHPGACRAEARRRAHRVAMAGLWR